MECWEETGVIDYMSFEKAIKTSNVSYGENCILKEEYKNTVVAIFGDKQVCETKQVESFEYKIKSPKDSDYYPDYIICITSCGDIYDLFIMVNEKYKIDNCLERCEEIITIPKKVSELDEFWLNENCDFIEACTKDKDICITEKSKLNKILNWESEGNVKFKKWKCGEYKITKK